MATSAELSKLSAPPAHVLLERARALVPLIAARVEESDRLRDTPSEVIAGFREAGLFRMFQPVIWGGYECDPRVFFEVQNIIAEHCASTAWVYGVLTVQSFVLALFDQQAQADVWGEDDSTLVSSSFQPVGKVERAPGGYRISGRWSFSSGSTHARWALLGGMGPADTPGAPAAARLFLVPRENYEIVDVWHTFGLRGTGSNDIVARDVLVPEHRTLKLTAGVLNVPAAASAAGALYRMPWLYLFSSSISNFAVGAGRGALRAFLDRARTRVSTYTGKASGQDPACHAAVARLDAAIDAVEAMFSRHVDEIMEKVRSDQPMDMCEGLRYRAQITSALRNITALVDDLMLLSGGRGLNLDSPVTRLWLDLSAARVHPGNDPGMAMEMLGRSLFSETGASSTAANRQ